jgi:hypothetical protein
LAVELFQFTDSLAESSLLLLPLHPVDSDPDPIGFPVKSLPANASLQRLASDVAITTAKNHERTGNPLLGGYHAHG